MKGLPMYTTGTKIQLAVLALHITVVIAQVGVTVYLALLAAASV
jgi:hypothetical protein